ncbi:Tat pathway signal protein [Actinomyces faecalis]|uniref:Tat pathway signal protein n=1 Tax=Actinomyces faecalis TaxID=2722820 RepID=UPI0015528FF0|nr:Tat pathway signal protein [Actinomyces faecalis]
MKPAHLLSSPALSRPARAGLALTLAGALLAGTSACDLRLGHGAPATLPTASAAEATRDALARQAALISSTAQVVSASGQAEAASQAARLIEDADVQVQALGGVWQPWPSPAPTPLPTTTPVPTAPSYATPGDLLDSLVAGAQQAHEAALQAPDAAAAQLYTALTVSWATAASQLATPLGQSEATWPTGAARQVSTVTTTLDADLLQAYDAARYAMEEVAARSADARRSRAQTDAAYADDVVNASIALGGTDSRLAAYAAPASDGSTSTDVAWAQQAWVRVCEQEIVSLGAPGLSQRAAAIDAAIDAGLRAQAWGAPLPALPGYDA